MMRSKYCSGTLVIIIISSIILFGLILRIWNLNRLFYFAIDEEKSAFIIQGINNLKHFPSVGYPSSVGFRLGPLLFYIMAPFYKLFNGNPLAWGYVSVFVSVITMILIYITGRRVNRRVGVIALLFYAVSYLNVLYDRRGWAVSFHSFIALVVLLSLLQLKRGLAKYAYILTIALMASSQFEIATILFIPLTLFCFRLFKIRLKKSVILYCFLLFLLFQSSLLFFDARHNFINTKYFLNYFRSGSRERVAKNIPLWGIRNVYFAHNLIPNTLARTFYTSTSNMAIEYANCPQYLHNKQDQVNPFLKYAIVIILGIFIIFTFRHRNKQTDQENISKIILSYMIILFGSISLYTYVFNGEMAEYYLLPFFAYFFILIALVADRLIEWNKNFTWFITPLLFIFVLGNSFRLFQSSNPYGFENKINAILYSTHIIGNHTFEVSSFQTCWYSGGFRYLYSFYGKEPSKSYMDQYLNEYYLPDATDKIDYKVTLLTPELIGPNPPGYEKYRKMTMENSQFSSRFGLIEVYITKLLK